MTSTPRASNAFALSWLSWESSEAQTKMTPDAWGLLNILAFSGVSSLESTIILQGWRPVLTSLTSRLGSSSLTVPTPVKMAQAWARQWWPSALAKGPVIHWLWPFAKAVFPSKLAAIFIRTQGKARVIREINPWFNAWASDSIKPQCTSMPAAFNRSSPWPPTSGFGSDIATITIAGLAAIKASTQGGVLPVWLQGSKVT